MSRIVSEALIERLADWGVDTVFGLPGDGINGILEGLRRHQDRVRFVLVHHEEAAAFMATGYAKATGRLGVCLATSGPGGIGLLGTRSSEELMEQIDTLFMVGTNFPYTKHLPAAGKVRVAQIEAEPARAGGRIPTELPVVGDAKEALAGLLPLLKQRSDTSFLENCQKEMASWRQKMTDLEDAERDPIAPQYVVSVLSELAADDAILTCDSGTIATWAARHWMVRGGREFFLSGNLATMAPGMAYAIGMQQAFPGRQVIACVGDGGFAMLMAEFLTAIQHRLPVKVVISNNNSLGQILWEQMVLGYPEHGVRYPEPSVNYAALAEPNGGLGIKVEKSADVRGAIERALGHDGPALVDVNVNPDEPPLPGKIEYQQAKKFAEAFLKGQPRKATIATTPFRDKIQQLKSWDIGKKAG